MTATDSRVPTWDCAALARGSQGIPWWSAVLLAMGLSATGVFLDLHRLDTLGRLFQVSYFAGCVLAVALVQRRGLFGPMVQPPLILGITVPSVVVLAGAPTSGGLAGRALDVGEPLINGFPTMALTTGVVLAIGGYRLVTQRAPASGEKASARKAAESRPAEQTPVATKIRRTAVDEAVPVLRASTRERLAELAADRRPRRPVEAPVERAPAPVVPPRPPATPARARGATRGAVARAATNGTPDETRTTPVPRPTAPREPRARRVVPPVPGRTPPPPPPPRQGPNPPRVPAPLHRSGDNGPQRVEPVRNDPPRGEHQMTEAQRQAALRISRSRRSSA